MKDNKTIKELEFSYDNMEILNVVQYLLGVVINDIEYMNKESFEIAEDNLIDYDLGNGKYIMKEDLESIESILDTIEDIKDYNGVVEQ